MGAYICGEETSLIESLEGKPGKPVLSHHSRSVGLWLSFYCRQRRDDRRRANHMRREAAAGSLHSAENGIPEQSSSVSQDTSIIRTVEEEMSIPSANSSTNTAVAFAAVGIILKPSFLAAHQRLSFRGLPATISSWTLMR
jgi:hypothetical protein